MELLRSFSQRLCVRRIKGTKETQRRAAERRMREAAEQRDPSPGEQGACETLTQLNLEERRARKVKEKQRNKEHKRYGRASPLPRF